MRNTTHLFFIYYYCDDKSIGGLIYMEIDRLVKKEENTEKNIPDPDKFFTVKEKSKFFAGYGFETFMVSQRFVNKMAALEDAEHEWEFDIPTLQSAIKYGILTADGQHLEGIKLMFDENYGWGLLEGQDNLFYLKDYGTTWRLHTEVKNNF